MTGEDIVEDRLLDGALRLRQPRRGHRAGTDAVLLASAAAGITDERIADLGAGAGAVGLILAARFPAARITLVEREPSLIGLAAENIALNGFAGRVTALAADVLAPAARRRAMGLEPSRFERVFTNPPWFGDGGWHPSPDRRRRTAHILEGGSLADWLRGAADILVPGGRLAIVHRADALTALLAALSGRFGALAIRPVQARLDTPAIRLIVSAVKGSRAPLRIDPPLVLHAGDRFTPEVEALHRMGAAGGERVDQ